jgi:hypothetical protein
MGVPREAILIENRSTNTGENIHFTRELLAKLQLDPRKFILVHKPYMERRAFATFRKVWPEKQALVTSPQMSFEDYPNQEISKREVISIMVGDLQRIRFYPAKGFQIPQEIPPDVWAAGKKLMQMGYSKMSRARTLERNSSMNIHAPTVQEGTVANVTIHNAPPKYPNAQRHFLSCTHVNSMI